MGVRTWTYLLGGHNSTHSTMLLQQSEQQPFREAVGRGRGRGRWHWLLVLESREAHSFATGVCRAGGGGRRRGGPGLVSPLRRLCQVGMTLQKRRQAQVTEVVCGRAESTPRME